MPWVAIEKVIAGMLHALIAGLVVIPLAWLVLRPGVDISIFGCAYYPWSALKNFPILQNVVLINPLVYASEGMRATLVPQFPHFIDCRGTWRAALF